LQQLFEQRTPFASVAAIAPVSGDMKFSISSWRGYSGNVHAFTSPSAMIGGISPTKVQTRILCRESEEFVARFILKLDWRRRS